MYLKKNYKELKIKDLNNNYYEDKNIKNSIYHIENFHSNGTSIHEEEGFYFKVDDNFRKKLKKIKKIL